MAFTIPNDPNALVNPATYEDQAEPDKVEIDMLAGIANHTGVISGGAGSKAAGALDVEVLIGEGMATGKRVNWATGEVTLSSTSTNPRKDIIVISSAGVITVRAGTADANPNLPNMTAGDIPICVVFLPGSTSTLTNNMITDKRITTQERRQVYNIKGHGALGDGSTDDTTAIQNTLDKANTDGGGKVYVPPGLFITTSALTMYSGTTLEGDGRESIIRLENNNDSTIDCIVLEDNAEKVAIHNLQIHCSPKGTSTKANAALKLVGAKMCFFSDIWISSKDGDTAGCADRWEYGIHINDASGKLTKDLSFTRIMINAIKDDSGSCGLKINGVSLSRHVYFSHLSVQSRTQPGGTGYTTPGEHGLWLNAMDGFHIAESEFIEWNRPVRIDDTGGGTFITNSKFSSVSMEVPKATDKPGLEINNSIAVGTLSFWGCTMYAISGNSPGMTLNKSSSTGDFSAGFQFVNCWFDAQGTGAGVEISNTGGESLADWRAPNFVGCNILGGGTGPAILVKADMHKAMFSGCTMKGTYAIEVEGNDLKSIILSNCDMTDITTE